MGYLGELVSEYLIVLEELDLIGITDRDVSKFHSTSVSSVVGNIIIKDMIILSIHHYGYYDCRGITH